MTNTEIIEVITDEIIKDAKKHDENSYLTGYRDGLKKALKIIRDHDSAVLDAMASYYEGV